MAILLRTARWGVIKISPIPMSDELRTRYEQQVRKPGQKWLDTHPLPEPPAKPERPRDYWRNISPDLAKAFHRRCAYTAMFVNYDAQVDHFVSLDEDRSKAYEWDNFRYCVGWFNSKKRHTRSDQILDPLIVEEDWFELSWRDLQLRGTDQLPNHLRDRAEYMLEKLGLRNGATIIRNRESYLEQFIQEGESALPLIERYAPLVAKAIKKNWHDAVQLIRTAK
jgi:hypothetical protein